MNWGDVYSFIASQEVAAVVGAVVGVVYILVRVFAHLLERIDLG